MVVKDTLNQPRHLMERQKEPKKMSIETPLGKLESDSGNHLIDVLSIGFVIVIFFMMKKFYEST
jgi:hypothetical protein|tara:strand:- start:540 stop:731 length:192 start_codon:yes stop_codon:yes gene_type:complete